jgi:NTE family protein
VSGVETRRQTPGAALARSPLFEGLAPRELEDILPLMRPVEFEGGGAICREGEPGTTLFVLVDGLADVLYPGGGETEVRLRSGDVIGEMSLVSGEARSATVLAAIPTTALELDQDTFTGLLLRYPVVGANLGRIVSRRLARTRRNQLRDRGEAVALLAGSSADSVLPEIIHATETASPRPVAVLDARDSLEGALAALDDALLAHGTVLVVAPTGGDVTAHVLDQTGRGVALVDGREADALGHGAGHVELAILGDGRLDAAAHREAVRVLAPERGAPGGYSARDVAWLGRHLSRTKLGLALGAGGSKGYAHVGTLHVLERVGYTVDCVAGASVGAIVGAFLGLGMDAAAVEERMRRAFSPERVAAMFTMSFTGAPTELVAEAFRETTEGKTFDDLVIPLSVMTVDLVSRRPAPVTDGPLWQALMAATSLAGMYPPYERGDQRLVDGLALVPVPTGSAIELGADVTLSVNILNRDTLEAWPGDAPVPEAPPARAGSMMLDTMLEVMDLSQLESSVRHAELADVVVSPRFGPGSWRDFHLADLFLEAGRQAADEQLPLLHSLARPQGAVRPS